MTGRGLQWLPVIILVLLVALTFWLEQLVRPTTPRGGPSGRNDPDLIVDNFTARKMGPDGSLRYTLTARKMTHYPAEDTSRLEAVSFEASTPGQPNVTATSRSGAVSEGGDRVVLEGDVIVNAAATEKAPAWKLTTPRLTLLPDENVARSEDGVRFESRDISMTGASFVFNTETRILNLKQLQATYQRPQQ
jgi:lipopolysaccharide export system protein LptC